MIFGIGIDIVELHRIENMLSRQARFPQRILTEAEYARFTLLSDKRKILSRFVVSSFNILKAELFADTCAVCFRKGFFCRKSSREKFNFPFVRQQCKTAKLDGAAVHVSITHTKEYAAAQVVIERLSR
jgi:holo-[acyl-carrier protein] synthase